MDPVNYQTYFIPALVIGYFAWRFFKIRKIKISVRTHIANGAQVVDVRSGSEFQQRSRPGSINIPLNEIGSRANELDRQKTIVLCCASGARSRLAVDILKKNGFSNVVNAGSWTNTL